MKDHPIRVLIVDDSALMRQILKDIIGRDERFEVLGTARDGEEALEKIQTTRPDVVTLDVEMPRLDGLSTLRRILRDPLPVIMVSALTQRDADVTLKALELGAVDHIAKPVNLTKTGDAFAEALTNKVHSAAQTDVPRMLRMRKSRSAAHRARQGSLNATSSTGGTGSPIRYENGCIALGISTGGPPALTSFFEACEPPLPPMVIVQHMPENFTKAFADRLDSISPFAIKEAETGDVLESNTVLIAPGGRHLRLERKQNQVITRIVAGEPVSGHKPSVDVMMKSAAQVFGRECLGVIMTGMGCDGADGCVAIGEAGGYVIGQDQESSDVYGMNRAAFLGGGVNEQFSLEELPQVLNRQCRKRFRLDLRPLART